MDDIQKHAAEVAARMKGQKPAEPRDERDVLAEKRAEVLRLLGDGVSIVDAAACVGRDRMTLWRWRKEDPAYGEAVQKAIDDGIAARTAHRREMREGLADKALKVLHDALDGKRVTREQMTVAIFTAKADLGMVETTRVETVEVVPILDDVPADA